MTKDKLDDSEKFEIIEELDYVCEECNSEDESVSQNLILTGFKLCKSCRTSKTVFPL
tara:strand:+ start:481 stop:651 length:171 start_codon:yes stop_codon:yes gene_type:complete